LRSERIAEARRLLEEAVAEIRGGLAEGAADPPECAMLEGMRDVLQPKLPVSQRHELERRIQSAISAENYELAAILRDELRQLRG
jgi:excinuclease UvrABC helicase subunit UvrB